MHIKHMQTSVQGHIMVRAEQLVQRAASHVRSLPEFREVKKKQKNTETSNNTVTSDTF